MKKFPIHKIMTVADLFITVLLFGIIINITVFAILAITDSWP